MVDHADLIPEKDPATVDRFSISGNDLILTHEKYYDRRFDATDSLRDWKLINVEMNDCDPKKLTRLIKDREIEEVKIVETKKGKKLIFYSYTEVYSFRCEEIEQEIRGYNRKEIVDMVLEKEEYLNEVGIQNTKFREFIIRFCRFISGESKDHRNLIALHQDKNIPLTIKSMHYLEILARVKDKLDDLEKSLA